jgi:hypothetical protein
VAAQGEQRQPLAPPRDHGVRFGDPAVRDAQGAPARATDEVTGFELDDLARFEREAHVAHGVRLRRG